MISNSSESDKLKYAPLIFLKYSRLLTPLNEFRPFLSVLKKWLIEPSNLLLKFSVVVFI